MLRYFWAHLGAYHLGHPNRSTVAVVPWQLYDSRNSFRWLRLGIAHIPCGHKHPHIVSHSLGNFLCVTRSALETSMAMGVERSSKA